MNTLIMLRITTALTCLSTLSSSIHAPPLAPMTLHSENILPAAVHHDAVPYGFQPDPNPPDSSKPKGDGMDEAFANRVRNRKAKEILRDEIEEKFVRIYGEKVSMGAKCTSFDPGNQNWHDPLPTPFNVNTTDRIALEDHTLREIVRKAVRTRKRATNTNSLPREVVEGIGIVHNAPTTGIEGDLHYQSSVDLSLEDINGASSPDKRSGVKFGEGIESNLSQVVKEQQQKRREKDTENILNVVEID
jgi:hypothetical protein